MYYDSESNGSDEDEYGFGYRYQPSRRRNPKKNNWFERLSNPELKSLCKAAKLSIEGGKQDLSDRLDNNKDRSKYGEEGTWSHTKVDNLKAMCRGKKLKVGGKKFDLVLRLLQNEFGTEEKENKNKRKVIKITKIIDKKTGKVKIKKTKVNKPTPASAYKLIDKEINSQNQRKYQSYWGRKDHSGEVYSLLACLVDEYKTKYLESEPLFGLEMAEGAFNGLYENFETMRCPGYEWEPLNGASEDLHEIFEKVKPLITKEQIEKYAKWTDSLNEKFGAYGLDEDGILSGISEMLRKPLLEKK